MANRIQIPKVSIDGKEYNMCPVCGGPCSAGAWNAHKKCLDCQKLIINGHSIEETKVIRMRQRNLLIEDSKKKLLKPKSDTSKLNYNFRNMLPKGINVKGNTASEGKLLTDIYSQYFSLYGHLVEFNSLINPILTSVIESYRITEILNKNDLESIKDEDKRMPISVRKEYLDLKGRMEDQVRKSQKQLEDIKNNRVSQGGNILINEFKKMIKFHHEQNQYYMGVAVCDTCNKRLIFKTEFPTFRTRYEEVFVKLIEELRESGSYDEKTLNEVKDRTLKRLEDDAFIDTYVAYHTRQLEKALM